jgi:hypothetical protein
MSQVQARMGRGIHGLPKVSPELAMPNPSTPCRRATPKTAVFYPLGYPMPYGPASGFQDRGDDFVYANLQVLLSFYTLCAAFHLPPH